MPTPKSSPHSSKAPARGRTSKSVGSKPAGRRADASTDATRGVADGLANFAEQVANRILRPLGIVMLTRDRIQETLDEAAERGRVTRTDANDLVAELFRRGRQQTDELLSDVERFLGAGRDQLGSVRLARLPDSMERLMPRGMRTSGSDASLPIAGYDDLTARQVDERLKGLTAAELRKVRDYELRHANRKSVLSAIERSLS